MVGNTCEVVNKWRVNYCLFLLKIFDAHINVEFCNSIKSIKYVCKYANKGSYAHRIQNNPDEVSNYQQGR